MIVFTEDCDQDLKRKEAPAASMALPAGAGKKRKASTAEKKMEEAAAAEKKMIASESGGGALNLKKQKKQADSLFEEGEMLKLRQEYWEAVLLLKDKFVPGALDRWLERKKTTQTQTQQVPAVDEKKKKKKKKVVRIITPNGYMEDLIKNPDLNVMKELSDEEIAKRTEMYRQSYAIARLIDAKNHTYQQALIAQYRAFGFAYDEKEVTDDDEKEAATDDEAAAAAAAKKK